MLLGVKARKNERKRSYHSNDDYMFNVPGSSHHRGCTVADRRNPRNTSDRRSNGKDKQARNLEMLQTDKENQEAKQVNLFKKIRCLLYGHVWDFEQTDKTAELTEWKFYEGTCIHCGKKTFAWVPAFKMPENLRAETITVNNLYAKELHADEFVKALKEERCIKDPLDDIKLSPEAIAKTEEMLEQMRRNQLETEDPGYLVRISRGEWILDETDNSIKCNKCGCRIYANDISNGEAHFCPNCGTDMRG